MTSEESSRMAESTLINAYALLLEHGPQLRLTKREMDVFELGVFLGQVATVEQLEDHGHLRSSASSVPSGPDGVEHAG